MRLISTHSLKGDSKLAKPVYNGKGKILINENVSLTERMINRLLQLGVTYVYIQDDATADIEIKQSISQETRSRAMEAIESAFDIVYQEKELSRAFVFDKLGKKFSRLINDILQDVKNNKEAISLLSDVYCYDHYIFAHSLNVTIYSLALGLKLNLPNNRLEEIGLGAILHDVGKTMIPLDILLKPGRLSSEEYEEIKMHTDHGFNILRNIPTIPLVVAHCAYQHHERIDGSGYPRGLEGQAIHQYSRMIGVADVFDAVTSNRVYRSAMLPHEGLEILYTGAGTQFELELVDAFRKSIAVYPVGLSVVLNDGRKGIVVKQNENLSERPIVRILEEIDEKDIQPYEIDLSNELTIVISETDTTLMGKNKV